MISFEFYLVKKNILCFLTQNRCFVRQCSAVKGQTCYFGWPLNCLKLQPICRIRTHCGRGRLDIFGYNSTTHEHGFAISFVNCELTDHFISCSNNEQIQKYTDMDLNQRVPRVCSIPAASAEQVTVTDNWLYIGGILLMEEHSHAENELLLSNYVIRHKFANPRLNSQPFEFLIFAFFPGTHNSIR